jgi:uncharacterized protein (TIGR00661 family)
MKILFTITGIGFGDATREHANILAIKRRMPKTKILVAGYDNSYSYFQDKFKTIKIQGYKLIGKNMKFNPISFGLQNIFLPFHWVVGTLKVRLESLKFIPDIIISDFEPVGISLAKVLRRKCIIVFGYDPELYKNYKKEHKVNKIMQVQATYFEKLYNQADLVIVPTFKQKEKRHLLYSYINPIIRIKPNQLKSEKELTKELKIKKKPILVMLGGSEFGTKLAKNINHIAKTTKEEFIIFGGNLNIKLAKNVKYIRYTPNFLKYLKVCKGVITLAGHKTLSEALIYKKPILCFPIQDHIEQILNAYALRDTIMVSHNSSLKAVRKTLKAFIANHKKIEKNIKKLNTKNNGSDQVVDLIKVVSKHKYKSIISF